MSSVSMADAAPERSLGTFFVRNSTKMSPLPGLARQVTDRLNVEDESRKSRR
jgi:hypothetical protein